MSEEEKKVIETFKKGYGLTKAETEILSNLIEKQRKEIEELKLDLEEMVKSNNHKKENWVHKNTLNSYIHKGKIRELKQTIHNTLDGNGITRGYQQIIDKYFDELLEEN